MFFAAFHEFVTMMKGKYGKKNMNSNSTDGEMPLIAVHVKGTCIYIMRNMLCKTNHSSYVLYLPESSLHWGTNHNFKN